MTILWKNNALRLLSVANQVSWNISGHILPRQFHQEILEITDQKPLTCEYLAEMWIKCEHQWIPQCMSADPGTRTGSGGSARRGKGAEQCPGLGKSRGQQSWEAPRQGKPFLTTLLFCICGGSEATLVPGRGREVPKFCPHPARPCLFTCRAGACRKSIPKGNPLLQDRAQE